MSYMGKVDVKASDIKRFSVTGSTSATHALSWTAPSEQALIITINGVKQHDGSYTIAGTPTTITLSSALVATDEMEVIGINDIGQTNTVAQDSIVTDMIRDDAVTSAKLANAINITSGNSLTIDSGATITNNGTNGGGFGKVLQVVSTTKTDTFTSSSTSFVDITGLSASITPSSTSNKILISVNIAGNGTPAGSQLFARLLRDSTPISVADTAGSRRLASANPAYINEVSTFTNTSFTFLDSPSSTSSITYKIQGSNSNAGTFYINRSSSDGDATNRSRGTSAITLMEIAG